MERREGTHREEDLQISLGVREEKKMSEQADPEEGI